MSSSGKLPPPDYETRDAAARPVALAALVAACGVAGVLAVSAWIYHARYAGRPTAPFAAGEKTFTHGAEWQSSVARDWADQDRRTQHNLTTYGWIDRKSGVVRIPIERAMSLIAREATP
jgi:hypothetical protein